tara:strand:+ start:277 stop:576 length:300 start_codon:yes stop_codon:yes gene_type:complete
MKNKLNKILNSLEGIREAKPKPYLFTRINLKIEKSIEDDILYRKIERPVVILTSIFIIILALYNFDFVTTEEIENNFTMEEIYFEEDRNDLINLTTYEE